MKKFLSLEFFTPTPWLTWLTNIRYGIGYMSVPLNYHFQNKLNTNLKNPTKVFSDRPTEEEGTGLESTSSGLQQQWSAAVVHSNSSG